jgi:monoamine oxidase
MHADVIVVGAGLAGLNAALCLQAAGKDVLVIEARGRVGGRLESMQTKVGTIELGAVEVGENYARFLARAKELGVGLKKPDAMRVPGLSMHFDGRTFADSEWPKFTAEIANTQLQALPPALWLSTWLANTTELTHAADWTGAAALAFDVSLAEFLKKHRGASDAELRLAEIASNFNDFREVSALDVLRRDALRKAAGPNVGTLAVIGGSQSLPTAMGKALQRPVFQALVQEIGKNKSGQIALRTDNGQQLFAKDIVIAVPGPALENIALPVFSAGEFDTVQALWRRPMTRVTTLQFAPKTKYWEVDGLSPNMWIDGPLERVFAAANSAGVIERILVWINGRAAERLDHLAPADLQRYVELELTRVRPSCSGQLELLTVKSWGQDPFAGGAYAEIDAGQCLAVQQATLGAEKLKHIAFAGEHTVFDLPGMEAALASGERAAAKLLQR